jgi:hypothetical protein
MASVLSWSAIDRGFEPPSGKTKDYEIGISCFSAQHMHSIKEKEQRLVDSPWCASDWNNDKTKQN